MAYGVKVSVNFTMEQYHALVELAQSNEQTITDCIISNLPIPQENKLTLSLVKEKIDSLNNKEEFSLPSLFKGEWEGFSKRSRLSIGTLFSRKVKANEISNVEFIRKDSGNLSIYRKI